MLQLVLYIYTGMLYMFISSLKNAPVHCTRSVLLNIQRCIVTLPQKCCRGRGAVQKNVIYLHSQQQLQLAQSWPIIKERCL